MKELSDRRIDGCTPEKRFSGSSIRLGDMTMRRCRVYTAVLAACLTMMTAFTLQSYAGGNTPIKIHKGEKTVLSTVLKNMVPPNAAEKVVMNPKVGGSKSRVTSDLGKRVSADSVSWVQTNGPYGGLVNALAVNSYGYIFAGTYAGGVFKSTDNGNSWTQAGLTNTYIYSLAVNSTGYIFAGTEGEGLYRSEDNGNSWAQLTGGLSATSNVYSLAVNASGYIIAGVDTAVYISKDNGSSWTLIGHGPRAYALTFNASGYIFAGTSEEIAYTTNSGSSWTNLHGLSSGVSSLVVSTSGYIFAGTWGSGVYLSTNNGASWTPLTNGLSNNVVNSLAINSSGYVFAGTTGGVFLSTNNGSNWTLVNAGLANGYVASLSVNSSGYVFAGSWGEGVYLSTDDGTTWTQMNSGFTSSNIWSLSANSSGNIFAGADGGGIYESSDRGSSWALSGLIGKTVRSISFNSAGNIFAGTSGGVFISSNSGTSWTQSNTGLTDTTVYSSVINSSGHIFVGTDTEGVYRSTNNGAAWTHVNSGLGDSSITSLVIDSSGHIFAGTWGDGVYLSTDDGTSWSRSGLANSEVYSFAINSSGNIFAGTWGNGVYISTNGGGSWTAVSTGLANTHVQSLAINSSGYIFAGTWLGGVYESTDNGASWSLTGLSGDDIQSVALDSTGYLFAGSLGGGVYRSSNSTIVVPSKPSLAGPANASSYVSINPTLTWNVTTGATSYRLQASTDSTFATTIYDASGLTGTSRSLSGLAYSTKYYWHVDASNSAGTGAWSATWSFTTASASPPVPTLASPANGLTGVGTKPTFTWNASPGSTSYELQVSKVSAFSSTVFDRSNIASTSQSVSGLSRGTTYYWRVNASNPNGTSGWSTVDVFTTFTYQSSIQVSTQYTPPATIDSSHYRMIGLPGDIDVLLSSVVTGTQRKDWNAYWDNGDNQNYLEEYDGSGRFYFLPGTAFWILSRDSFSVSQNVTTVTLDTADCFSITVHSGWNLISDPFEKSVDWSSVQSLNGTSQPIWAFSSGSYSQPSTLDPYEGYYFFNDIGASQLRIPYVYSPTVSGVARLERVADQNLVMMLSENQNSLSSITVGVRGAGSGFIFAPPGNFERARICVVDSAVHAGWKELVTDYRDTIGTGQEFDFYVRNRTGKSLKLSSTTGISQYEVYLIDKDLNRSYNLKGSTGIAIPSYNKIKNYSILMGDKPFIEAKLAELQPKDFLLYQNYPNPFNPVTVIRFEVPRTERVSLAIYDVLGRMVKSIVDGNISPGYYEVPFDGTGLSSGVYFYRLSAGPFTQVKKMVLLK